MHERILPNKRYTINATEETMERFKKYKDRKEINPLR